jgi:muramoyltetrapeptide carboxypeptidase LdcA involved in peptidoglycan recycling
VVADVNFGHASPRATLPIGGEAVLDAGRNGKVNIRITKH